MALETRYAARRDWPVERLVESLAGLLTTRRRQVARQRVTFLDTSDGRVARAGACLTMTEDSGGTRLQWQHGNQRIACTLDGKAQFAWDLPPGPVRQRIDPIIEARRLLPLADIEQDAVLLDVMDETRKTIARINIVAGRVRAPKPRSAWQPLRPFLTLNALRGYDEQCTGPIAIIDSRPGIERTDLALQSHVLRTLGADAPHDVSVYRAALDPSMRADIGSLTMHRELLRIVSANHAGVVADLDSEFLHDFRIGVRRSRTLFEQLQGVLPQAEVDHFSAELAWLGRITGTARDLDVLRAALRSTAKHLDADHRRPMLAALEQERILARRDLVAELTSARYRHLIERWTEFLAAKRPGEFAEACSALPLMTLVSQRGWGLYQNTLCAIERVRNDTPADELHQIRIAAKKLRYLIDAAIGLYAAEDLAVALQALGRLQSVLGELGDAGMQASWYRRYAAALGNTERAAIAASRAAEALADLADRRAQALRKPMNQQLLRFGESATRLAFERIFHIKHLIEIVQ